MRPLAFLLLCLTPSLAHADFPARVVGVSDGDTLTVLTAEKKQVKVLEIRPEVDRSRWVNRARHVL